MDSQNTKLIEVLDIPKKHRIGVKKSLKEMIILASIVKLGVDIWKQTIQNPLLTSQNYDSLYRMDGLYVENVTIKQNYLPKK